MKNIVLAVVSLSIIAAIALQFPREALGQLSIFRSSQVGSSPQSGYILSTDGVASTWIPDTGGGGGTDTLFNWNQSTNIISTDGASTTATTSLSTNGFTANNATTTNATSTNLFTTLASTTKLFVTGLSTCDSTTGKLTYDASTGTFGCGTDFNTGGSGGLATTSLSATSPITYSTTTAIFGFDFTTNNTWTGNNLFSDFYVGTTSNNTSQDFFLNDTINSISDGNFTLRGSSIYTYGGLGQRLTNLGGLSGSVAAFIIPKRQILEGNIGDVHDLITQFAVRAPVVTNADGTTNYAATVYIDGAPTGPATNEYALWVEADKTRLAQLDVDGLTTTGTLSAGGATSTTLAATLLGINGDVFSDLTGSGLTVVSGALTANNNALATTSLSATSPLNYAATVFSINADGIGDTQLAFNTGQHLTTTSDVTFAEATTTNFFSTNASTTYATSSWLYADLARFINATSSNLAISTQLTFGGVSGTTWAAFCTSITGHAGLCDGDDAAGGGGGADGNWTYNATDLFIRNSTTTNDIVMGATATATAPFFFDVSQASLKVSSTTQGGTIGIGTSSPFASLSVHLGANETKRTVFAVASSTATATTTLFSISNTGTTTAVNGFDITNGCFSKNGTCIGGTGTVTSVDMSVPTGLSISGNPVTTAGTLALTLTAGYEIPTSANLAIYSNKLGTTSIDTSAELAGILTDETGSGLAVFGTNATLSSTTLLASTTLVNATSSTFATTLFTLGSDVVSDITGTGLSLVSGALTVNDNGLATTSLSATSPLNYAATVFSINADGIGDTQLAFNTGQHLTTTSDVTFSEATTTVLSSTLILATTSTSTNVFTQNLLSTNSTSTANEVISGALTFNGVRSTTWAGFCTTITGSADLCDGSDATGAGGGTPDWIKETNFGALALTPTTTIPIWAKAAIYASSTLNIKANRFSQHNAGFLDLQRDGADFTLMRIRAPYGDSNEATLSLVNDLSATDTGIDEEFVDFYNERYEDSLQWGLRQAYSGTGIAKPFIVGHWQTTGSKDAGNKLIVLPSGTVAVARATSTIPQTLPFYVASSTATTLARFDTTPGTPKFAIGSSGDITMTGASGNMTLNPNVDGGQYNLSVDTSGTLAIFGSSATFLNINMLDGTFTNASNTSLKDATSTTLFATYASTTRLGIFGLSDASNRLGTNGQVLQTNGTAAYWVATSTLGLGGAGGGTVTSVDMSVPTGLTISGNPITTSGTLALSLTAGYNIPLTASTSEWAKAYASSTILSATSPLNYVPTTGVFSINADGIGDTQLAFNTGQHLTATSDVTFSEATTTASFATVASTSALYVTGLATCDATTGKLTYSNGTFGCGTDFNTGGSGGLPDWNKQTNFGALSLTPTTTIPIWIKDHIYASSSIYTHGNIILARDLSAVPSIPFYVASSTATTLARFDGAAGSPKFAIGSSGDITMTGTSGNMNLNANVDGGQYNFNVDTTGTLAFFGSAATTLNVTVLDGTFTASNNTSLKDATSTTMFSTIASSTNLFSTKATFTNATSTTLAATLFGINGDVFSDLTGTALSVTAGVLGVTADAIGDTQLAFNTGQHLTTTSDVTFSEATTTQSFATVASSTNLFANVVNFAAGGLTNIVQAFTALGTWDFGGATSLEIPNGAGNTVDTIGEIALDTTDDQLLVADGAGTVRVMATDEFKIKDVTIASTSVAFVSGGILPIGSHKDGLELTQYRCYVSGGTSVILSLSDGTNDTETITCATTVTSDTDVATNDTFTADEIMNLKFGTISSTVNYVHFEAYARITRE